MASLYIARGHSNLVKVGRTKNLKSRLVALRQEFRRFGNEIVEVQSIDWLSEEQADRAERRLIHKLNGVLTQYSGREWFEGDFALAFGAAAIAAQEAFFYKAYAVPRLTPEQAEARIKERIEREARQRQAQIEWRERHRQGVQARKALRDLRRREIAARVIGYPMPVIDHARLQAA